MNIISGYTLQERIRRQPIQHWDAARKGRLLPGMDADLVVLDGDPSKDVTAFARVRLTLRAGQAIYAAKARPIG